MRLDLGEARRGRGLGAEQDRRAAGERDCGKEESAETQHEGFLRRGQGRDMAATA